MPKESAIQTHSLMPLLVNPRFLRKAARKSMRRESSPGIDGLTWRQYRENFDSRLVSLSHSLCTGEWKPAPTKEVAMKDFAGKEFSIFIPTVEDRIVHRAMRNCIEPILDSYAFYNFVSGFRRGRNRLTSIRQAMQYVSDGKTWVADIDVADVSGHVTPDEVVDWVANWISDGSFLRLVRRALSGLPRPIAPGSGLSPLLINLRLVPVDQLLKDLSIVRFADNYCVFCNSYDEAAVAFETITNALSRFGLAPSIKKSKVRCQANPEDLFLIDG